MKIFLNIALVLSAFFSCYVEDIYLYFRPPQLQKVALITLRSHRSFNFDQEKAFGGNRTIALSQDVPLYSYLPERAESAKKKMGELIEKTSALQAGEKSDPEALVKYLKKEFEVELGAEVALRLLKYSDLKNLLAGILTIEESILQSKIVEDPAPLQGKKTAQVLYPNPVGTVAFPADEFLTLEEARTDLQKKVLQLFWQIAPNILNPVLEISLATLQPDLRYDQKEDDRRIEEIIQRYPSKIIPYKPGDVLVPFRKVLDEKDVFLLAASQEEGKKDLYGGAPWVLFAIIFLVVLNNLLLSRIFPPWWRKKVPYQLLLVVLIMTVLLMKACLLFTPFSIFALPIAILPLLLVLLHCERISITLTTILAAILVSFYFDGNFGIFLFFTFGGLIAVLASFGMRKRFHILIPSVTVGITNALVVLFLSMWGAVPLLFAGSQGPGESSIGAFFSSSLLGLMGWGLLGGLASGPLVLLLLPFFELSWHNASAFKLNRYSDLQHPLMRELLTRAPGTYQHTMSVAYLAEALAEAIGANSLLLTVAAYYHDIGKTAHPEFFIENQHGGKNPHDDLPASENTRIIVDHVKNGREIALQAGLPEVVADFIPQHHGTLLLEYFYDKAAKANPGAEVREEDFRYPGPKPQSVEAAILMIVDAVEATSRTIQEPTREKIETMVRHIIENRIADGQFDECDISTREMAKIVEVLIHSLEASFHTRVEYPWQEEEKSEEEPGNKQINPHS